MARLNITLAASTYDRTSPIFDGRVPIEGCEVNWLALSPEETFHRAFGDDEFDVSEISLSSHTATIARGVPKYVGIPAFTSRAFRHSGIYIRTDRGIKTMEDLRGKTIGLPEYQQTANVFIRGILKDEHGVDASEISWRTGGIEEPGRTERTPIKLPAGIECVPVPTDKALSPMLAAGEIDAFFSPREPSCFSNGAPNVDRLFPDYQRVEEDYFLRTGIFPIMHLIGIRRSLVEQHPWLPVSVYKAFAQAKTMALEELNLIGHLATMLPWCVAELERVRGLMGHDYWSYGVEPNRKQLDLFLRYHHEQGLSSRSLQVEDLFAHSTLNMSKN
jgi:4,5-dihydroxyphthalate decarboxylase